MTLELMSNLGPKTTGIPGVVLWVSVDDGGFPRLWVVLSASFSPEHLKTAVIVTSTSPPEVRGELPPEVAEQVARFVDKNREALLRYWNAEIGTREMLDLLETQTT